MKKISLEEILEGIKDNMRMNSIIYPLQEILFIMLIAIICGATSYARIELFGKNRMNGFGNISNWKTEFLMQTHFAM